MFENHNVNAALIFSMIHENNQMRKFIYINHPNLLVSVHATENFNKLLLLFD